MRILKVRSCATFFFLKKKIKNFEKISDFLKKCQKLKNGYFLTPKSTKIDQKSLVMTKK